MKRLSYQIYTLLALSLLFLVGCKKSDTASPDPVITEISPLTGPAGSSVTITGSNFNINSTLDTVWFNGEEASIKSVTSTAIVVTVPDNATTGKIMLATGGKKLVYQNDFNVELPVPVISSVSILDIAYGGSFIITGSGFNPDFAKNTVKFGELTATIISASKTQLVAKVGTKAAKGQVTLNTYGRTITYPTSFDLRPYMSTSVVTPLLTNLAADVQNNIYGDIGNQVIKVASSGAVSNLATIGTSSTLLKGTAVDAAGNVYVTGNNTYQIYKVDAAGVISAFAGSGTSGYADGEGKSAQFLAPVGLTIDGKGNLYVCDSTRIRKISPAGQVSTLAGSGTPGSTDGQGSAASFNALIAITATADGDLFVINNAGTIRKITAAGLVTTLNLKGPLVGNNEWNRPVSINGISAGTEIATDPSGNLFICHSRGVVFGTQNANAGLNFPVYLIQPSGFVTEFANGSFISYRGITCDSAGNIYISQRSNAYDGSFMTRFSNK